MLASAIMRVARAAPRGGHRLVTLLRPLVPGLGRYPATLKANGFILRGDLALNVFYPLAVYGYYTHQAVEDDVLAFAAKGARMIADVGGNIGYTTALMAGVAPDARIVTFEPLSLCQPYLDQVAAHFTGVRIVPKAVGAEAGTAEFKLRAQVDRSSFAGSGSEHDATTLSVPMTTLDLEFAGESVDLIKIDVEGFEDVVLAGGRETIRRCKPVVVFEAYEEDVLRRSIAFFDSLGAGYTLFTIAHQGELRPLESLTRGADEVCNFVAWPAGRSLPDGRRIPRSYDRP
ncbi:FkbM family methyltransferase [Sphingomonas bacterium]|uniref:FkbM family methyltransferase n=1 Tax=Sphingomonas bacterium TaxID=1895847 RepID=UPI00262BDDF8|nr:FkbM family methyltransferase [Sphingomonas bacterium]MDB5679116.1 FkbM family methyltransferase [Sphingomonas bacterium]